MRLRSLVLTAILGLALAGVGGVHVAGAKASPAAASPAPTSAAEVSPEEDSPAVAQSSDVDAARLDLNSASLEELKKLPIPESLARAILDHRKFIGYFESFYDLADVEDMTPQIMVRLQPLVSTLPPPARNEAMERYDRSFRQVERFLSDEGASEELADDYLDALREPLNINTMSLYDLMGFQNVSPVDAVAILKTRERLGRIESQRQLRSAEGLSYWAFRNLRDFVVYEDEDRGMELHGDLQTLSFNTPYNRGGDDQDIITQALLQNSIDRLSGANPAVLNKLRLRLGSQFKGGIMSYRQVGEEDLDETVKGFVSWKPPWEWESYKVDKVVVGNYRLAFGQGLVMDNTDFFLPRKTGYGFNKRPMSVVGDLARSHEFALRGGAIQFSAGRFHGTGFYSNADKDGVLNPDGPDEDLEPDSINRYIVMRPRFEQAVLDSNRANFAGSIQRDAFNEEILGGNLKFELWPGTYVGVTGYEARYDKPIDPNVFSLVSDSGRLEARDRELFADYSSKDIGDFRRVVGTEFQAVYENVALQGEYAKLDSNPDGDIFDAAPEAYVLNGYVQYGDFNFFALYRDYDLGFDNPYARAFSNDTRYEQTLLDSPFRLSNPLLAYLSANTPQMKPERGLFLHTRYRISRQLTITGFDFDQWKRVADDQDLRRYTLRMEYAPIWPLRFRLRQRFSSRGEQLTNDVRRFKSWDTRIEARLRLSGFDEMRVLFSTTNTQFAPRPRLSELPESDGPQSPLPQGSSPGQALQVQYRHHVNNNLMFMFSSLMYDGFLWNFEDNEFVLLDGKGFRNWALIRSRISDNLVLRFKATTDRLQTQSSVLFNRPNPGDHPGDNVKAQETAFRLQLDYTF